MALSISHLHMTNGDLGQVERRAYLLGIAMARRKRKWRPVRLFIAQYRTGRGPRLEVCTDDALQPMPRGEWEPGSAVDCRELWRIITGMVTRGIIDRLTCTDRINCATMELPLGAAGTAK